MASTKFIVEAIGKNEIDRLSNLFWTLLGLQVFSGLIACILCIVLIPFLRHGFSFKRDLIRPLFTYGRWVTVSNVVATVLVYLDRFLIGSLLTMKYVTYYTTPYEVIVRIWIIPDSLTITVFSPFSALWGIEAK